MRHIIPAIGTKIERLTLLEILSPPHGKNNVRLLCECKTVVERQACHWLSYRTKSCGCLNRELAGTRRRLATGEAARNGAYWKCKNNAITRGYIFNLTFDQFINLSQGNCIYCGSPPSNSYDCGGRFNGAFISNGIDRKDNSIGYEYTNCQSCCKICNYMKKCLSEEEFKKHIVKIYEHSIHPCMP